MMKRLILILSLLALPLIALPSTAGAVDVFPKEVCDQNKGENSNNSTVCQTDNKLGPNENPLFGPKGVLTRIINVLSIVVGIAAVIGIIISGMRFITSGSNPQEVTKAREGIIYALVALVVAVMAQVLVRFIISKL